MIKLRPKLIMNSSKSGGRTFLFKKFSKVKNIMLILRPIYLIYYISINITCIVFNLLCMDSDTRLNERRFKERYTV
jgi:hypothetical protein